MSLDKSKERVRPECEITLPCKEVIRAGRWWQPTSLLGADLVQLRTRDSLNGPNFLGAWPHDNMLRPSFGKALVGFSTERTLTQSCHSHVAPSSRCLIYNPQGEILGSGLRRGSTSRGGFSFPRRKRKKATHYLRGAALPAGLEGESPGCDPTRAPVDRPMCAQGGGRP